MKRITLERTGNRPLVVEGEKIAEASSRYVTGQEANRWHELALYRTTKDQLIVSIIYRTQWQGELEHHFVCQCDTEDDIVMTLRNHYDPNAYVKGYPGYSDAQKIKEERRAGDMQLRYDTAVSQLLAELPEEL